MSTNKKKKDRKAKPMPKASENTAKVVERKPPPIDYRKALEYLDAVAAQAPVSRQGHIQTQQAAQQLSMALVELEQLKKPKPE